MATSNSSEMAAKHNASPLMQFFHWWDQVLVRLSIRFGGSKPKELERFLKFATVGIVGAVIDFGVLNLLQATALSPEGDYYELKVGLATGTAFVSAVISNFIWNRYWTYPDSRSRSVRKQWIQFFVVSLAGLIFRLVWVHGLFAPFGSMGVDALHAIGAAASFTETAERQVGTNIAQFFAVWIVMIWNFFANRYWTYNDVE